MLIAAAITLLVSGFASFAFALAETSLFSIGKWQIRQLTSRSPRVAERLEQMLAQPQDLLATIVLGNTVANGVIVGTGLWVALQKGWPLIPTLAVLFTLILIGGEVIPKTLAVRSPETWALRVLGPMQLIQSVTRPLRQLAQMLNQLILRIFVTRPQRSFSASGDEEYHELLEMAQQQGTLDQSEKEIILQIIRLDQRTAKDIMRPRSQMVAIPDDLSQEEMVAAARKYRHRKIPIYDETPDTIVGILNTRALLLSPEADLSEVVEFPSFVPESMNLLQLLKSLQRGQRRLAIVLDEFGGTAGVVSFEDILEELVGPFRSGSEHERFVMERLAPGRWRVSGNVRIDDFRREYAALEDVSDVETMGGLMTQELEVVPAVGESVTFRGLKLTASAVDERLVRELTVEALKKGGR